MKKLIIAVAAAIVLMQSSAVLAKSGDVNGKIYATDIKTYINGVEVPAYNIGGKTAVVIEDIVESHCYFYNDAQRMLALSSVPTEFIGGISLSNGKKPGTPVGKTYESDIKTYIYDKLVPSFSLDGKMAVAIEDIAGDKEWSDIGARYFWNDGERTLSVDFMYDNCGEFSIFLGEKHLNAGVTEEVLTVTSDSFSYGGCSWDNKGNCVKYNETVVGKYFTRPRYYFNGNSGDFVLETENCSFIYWDMETLEKLFADVEPAMPTRQQVIDYYTTEMASFYSVKERLDTEEYTFMYLALGGVPHGGTELILKILDDGTLVDYADEFESVSYNGGKFFDNAVLDKKARTFSFRYDTDYIIDLDSGELKKN